MILTIGPGGSGLTFLNWSIIYLRGDNSYSLLTNQHIRVIDNPVLATGTAHGMIKDHITSTVDLPMLDLANSQSVVYVVPTAQSDMDYILQFVGKKIIVDPHIRPDELLARLCCTVSDNQFIKFINRLSTRYSEQHVKQVLIDCHKFFIEYYNVPDTYQNYYSVNYNDIFQNLDQKIYSIFEYLELPISQDRIDKWQSVYTHYRSVNQDFLSLFLGNTHELDNNQRIKIFKEILQWKNGLYQNT